MKEERSQELSCGKLSHREHSPRNPSGLPQLSQLVSAGCHEDVTFMLLFVLTLRSLTRGDSPLCLGLYCEVQLAAFGAFPR